MEDQNISEQIQIMQPRNRRFLSGTSVDQKQVLWNATTCDHMRPHATSKQGMFDASM